MGNNTTGQAKQEICEALANPYERLQELTITEHMVKEWLETYVPFIEIQDTVFDLPVRRDEHRDYIAVTSPQKIYTADRQLGVIGESLPNHIRSVYFSTEAGINSKIILAILIASNIQYNLTKGIVGDALVPSNVGKEVFGRRQHEVADIAFTSVQDVLMYLLHSDVEGMDKAQLLYMLTHPPQGINSLVTKLAKASVAGTTVDNVDYLWRSDSVVLRSEEGIMLNPELIKKLMSDRRYVRRNESSPRSRGLGCPLSPIIDNTLNHYWEVFRLLSDMGDYPALLAALKKFENNQTI